MPEPQRQRTFDRAERKFDLMQELGCDLLMVCSNVSPDSLGGIDRAAADFRELGERAAKRGLRVGFEALAWGRHINDYRDAWEVVRRADHPAIGLVLDSFHTFARKTDLKPLRAIPGDRIFLVQLADAPWLDMDVLSWSRHFRCFPGQGDMPLVDFMAAVQATGYQGDLSLEIFNDQFRAGSPRAVAVDGQRSLVYLMDQLRDEERQSRCRCSGRCRRARNASASNSSNLRSTTAPPTSSARFLAGLGFRNVAQPQIEGGDALDPRRDQSRHQQGKGRLRAFALHHAWAVGLRDRPEGRERGGDARSRRKAARHAVPAKGRPGRTGNSGGARHGRQLALFPRSDQQARQGLGRRVRAGAGAARAPAPA